MARLPAAAPLFVNRYWAGGAALLAVLAFWFDAALPLKFYPVLVNALLLAWFAYSLIEPPSLIERLARLSEANLPPAAVAYTRRVTQVWCGFFAVNGAIALYTALYASMAQWSFYNGFLAYLFIGVIFAGEYCARCRFKRRHGSTAQST
jgi:uncharacterized membrane protein